MNGLHCDSKELMLTGFIKNNLLLSLMDSKSNLYNSRKQFFCSADTQKQLKSQPTLKCAVLIAAHEFYKYEHM